MKQFQPLRVVIIIISIIIIYSVMYTLYTTTHIEQFGIVREGIVGQPNNIHPIQASSEVDKTLVSLLFSGLTTIDAHSGEVVGDLAQRWEVSDDGTQYTFFLRDDIFFHNGKHISARDVAGTIQDIQNSTSQTIKNTWSSITTEVITDKVIRFTLQEAYTPFLYETSVGIVPGYSTKVPIGSGPFKIQKIIKEEDRTDTIILEAAYSDIGIKELHLVFFENKEDLEEALLYNAIDSAVLDAPLSVPHIYTLPSLTVYGIFISQNRDSILSPLYIREALYNFINRDALRLQGYTQHSPFVWSTTPLVENLTYNKTLGSEKLKRNGWSIGSNGIWEKNDAQLSFTIYVPSDTEYRSLLASVVNGWKQNGVDAHLEYLPPEKFVNRVIKNRDFTAAFYGYSPNQSYDIYPFWHSSAINYPHLNIVSYTNYERKHITQ